MNRKELIERIKNLPFSYIHNEPYLNKEAVLEFVKHLDEPQKVKIPQVIAEYIKQKKDDDYHLLGAMIEIRSHKNKEIDEWFEEDDNMELFARAWLDGYELEEKRYLVKFKGLGHEFRVLKYNIFYNDWFTGSDRGDSSFKLHHTRKELEDVGFGWVFDCEGIEIEEVTE